MSRSDELNEKVVLITGASRGIGEHLVRRIASSGARVVCCARTAHRVETLAAELNSKGFNALAVAADVSSANDVASVVNQAIAHFGRIDVLVNNVGIAGPTKPIEETELVDWNATLAGNLTSTFLCLREVIPHMKRQGGGSVVNIGSVTGKRPLPYRVGYASAKMGIIGLTRTAAEELGRAGIRVNCICPGAVAGERLDEILTAQAQQRGMTLNDFREDFKRLSPIGALVTAEDIAQLTMFLASDASRHMTGQDINVSAGLVMS